jgi:hypothetical protein
MVSFGGSSLNVFDSMDGTLPDSEMAQQEKVEAG